MNFTEGDEIQAVLDLAKTSCHREQVEIVGTTLPLVLGKFCERIFDGIMCWPATRAGVLAIQACSSDYVKSTRDGLASRQCGSDGHWFVPEDADMPWSNYSECGKFYMEKTPTEIPPLVSNIYSFWIPIIKTVTHFGYVCSIVTLMMGLVIFLYIKKLQCPRNRLHMNLFLSFIMRAFMSLLKDGLFVKGTALANEIEYVHGEPTFNKENYSWVCKAIISWRYYFIISNYMFLLMEGTYLHNLMFLNMFAENGVAVYCIIGWALPLFFIIPWTILKAAYENVFCWTQKTHRYIALLIDFPIGASVIINFVLFIIIVRVLSVKLTSMYVQQRRIKYRKLLRATLILVPLFGIPYVISLSLSFYVSKSQTLEVLWLFFDQTFTAFQGFFTSLLYWIFNSEVQTEIKRKYFSFKDDKQVKRSRTISQTQQVTLPLTEDVVQQELHQQNNGRKYDESTHKESYELKFIHCTYPKTQ